MTLSTDTRQRIVAKATSIRVYIAVALVSTACVAVLFNISLPDWFLGRCAAGRGDREHAGDDGKRGASHFGSPLSGLVKYA